MLTLTVTPGSALYVGFCTCAKTCAKSRLRAVGFVINCTRLPLYAPEGGYLTAFNDALYDWNNSDTLVDFDYDTGQTAHTIGVENIGNNGPYGRTHWRCCNFGKRSFTYAFINSGQVPDNAPNTSSVAWPRMSWALYWSEAQPARTRDHGCKGRSGGHLPSEVGRRVRRQ